MSALKWPSKDPDEIEDFSLDWTARLADDTIATSLWIVPSGITSSSESIVNDGDLGDLNNRFGTIIWLAGGTLGVSYTLVNRIETTGGRTYDQSVKVKIKTR